MSDSGAVSGTVARKLRKKPRGKPKKPKGKKVKVRFLLMSKARPTRKDGTPKGRTWHDDWPEFYERLKVLLRRYKMTIQRIDD